MNQQKTERDRGSRVLSENGWNKFQNALEKNFGGKCSNERLAELSKLHPDTVSKIRRRKEKVDRPSIEALFTALGLKLEEDDLSVTVRVSPPKLDPNFVGREGAIADLNHLIQQGAKAIVIHGKGGIGKTTLAWQFLHTQGFDQILDLRMAKETQNITSAESVIEEWLRRYFEEEPGREFGVTLDRLRQHLRNPNQRIGILIDNLEPALDQNGRCIEAHRKYVELFTALADPAVQSVTLITSRECLREAAVTVENYRLEGLDVAAWEEFFNSRKIQTDTEVLNAMHQAYGGNAKAMQIFPGAIKEFNNSLAAYWQANKDDLLIERELEGLVVSQFDRLQKLDLSAYKLLCRLGCYRYQDVPKVPENGLCCLLWDVPNNQHRRVIKSLRERSLVEFYNGEYWLHPVIRAEAVKRFRESEDWETANRKAADFWTESVKTVETIEDALKASEAYYHYVEINDYELAVTVIVKRRKNQWDGWEEGEPLGISFSRIGYLQLIISVIARITEKVQPSYSVSRIYNILGTLYEHTGHIHKSIQCNEQAKAIAIDVSAKDIEIVSLLNMGLCKIYIWELEEAVILFKQVIQISENSEYHRYTVYAWFCLAFVNSYFGDKYESEARQFALKIETFMSKTKLQSAWAKGYSLIFLGEAYRNLREYQKSFEKYRLAISYAEESHYTQVKAKAICGLAELYREQGDFTTALSHHTESNELLEKIGAKCDLAEAYYQLALTYQKMGDTEKSQPNFQQAIQLFTEMEAPNQVEKVQRAMENGENH
ncbi:tetratricopeptide repeat protein [Aerosakkonemataceae cyanobacterium BLCC-F50]|uniref:Tetratricopeptide repeat protein n=1 Tax=Floridaenema flaviceps BLCC-F50 TaxID=3153642 RepID=A0ABV4XYY5_9CYAN